METRESLNDHLSAMANLQYKKNFPMPASEKTIIQAANNLPKLFLPQRKFKKADGLEQSLPANQKVILFTSCNKIQTDF